MSTVIKNKTADELVIQGWNEEVSLEEMKATLQANGFMVNPFAILRVWLDLDEQAEERQDFLKT
jgi:hypothetical protein